MNSENSISRSNSISSGPAPEVQRLQGRGSEKGSSTTSKVATFAKWTLGTIVVLGALGAATYAGFGIAGRADIFVHFVNSAVKIAKIGVNAVKTGAVSAWAAVTAHATLSIIAASSAVFLAAGTAIAYRQHKKHKAEDRRLPQSRANDADIVKRKGNRLEKKGVKRKGRRRDVARLKRPEPQPSREKAQLPGNAAQPKKLVSPLPSSPAQRSLVPPPFNLERVQEQEVQSASDVAQRSLVPPPFDLELVQEQEVQLTSDVALSAGRDNLLAEIQNSGSIKLKDAKARRLRSQPDSLMGIMGIMRQGAAGRRIHTAVEYSDESSGAWKD